MRTEALVCTNCGGPLAAVKTIPAVVECVFCGAVLAVGHGPATITRRAALDASALERMHAARARIVADLTVALEAGRRPYDALRAVSAAHLGASGETDTLARVTLALADDFARETRASVVAPLVLSRIAEGYLRAVEELRDQPQAQLNLPFLAVTSSGPVHLVRTLTAPILGELARREPGGAAPDGAARADGATGEPPRKRRWWPF